MGQRCPDCARARPLPTYETSTGIVARALAAGVVVALPLGAAWGYFNQAGLRRGAHYDWSFWFALVTGFAVAEAVSWAARRKRGPVLAAVAIGSILLAVVVSRLTMNLVLLSLLFSGSVALRAADLGRLLQFDLTHLLFVGLACGIGYVRFR